MLKDEKKRLAESVLERLEAERARLEKEFAESRNAHTETRIAILTKKISLVQAVLWGSLDLNEIPRIREEIYDLSQCIERLQKKRDDLMKRLSQISAVEALLL